MKRLIALLLVLMLLAGCAVQNPEPTTVPTTEATDPPTEPTSPPGAPLYIANSELEQQTAGAVKAYEPHPYCEAVYPMGENLLLFMPQLSVDRVQVYGGDELYLQGTRNVPGSVVPGNRGVQISENGISYYNESLRKIVLLDADLQETDRIDLPWGAQGTPVVDPEQKHAYFCTENEIRVLDLETGIARLLRQENPAWQSIYDVCFGGRVLLCDVIDAEQNGYLAFIDTATGKLLGKETEGWDFDSYGTAFLLTNSEGNALYGTWETEILELTPAAETAQIWELLALGGALGVRDEEDSLVLDFYTLETGLRTASVTLPGAADVYSVVADAQNNCVWFLMNDGSGNKTLCRWDYGLSAVADETVYLHPRYTEQNPDVEGLQQIQAEADALAAANGMEIHIWKDAVNAPWDNRKADYRVSSFRHTLDMMKAALSVFPEGMIAKLASISATGVTSVSIVRGEGETAQAYFQWKDRSTYIAVETGEGGVDAYYNALYRVMDTYILNSNSILDEWDSKDPVNDRAMTFQYAMTEGMEDYFNDDDAYAKLKQLCKAIRDAFDLKQYEGELLWEQYLAN